jgi:16S rRNA (guanine527-N7)-methyltransferase
MIADEAQARRFCAERTDSAGIARLERLATLLTEENARQNLVSAASLDAIWLRHFADSLQLLDHVPRGSEALPKEQTGAWLDLGSGAGFPGLAVVAARPELSVVAVESRKRRVEWLIRAG